MKEKKATGKLGNRKVKSVGLKISIVISILLIVVLGAKTVVDAVRNYNSGISSNKSLQYEQTKKTDVRMMEMLHLKTL